MDNLELLNKWINESENVVFFGGAGVSTESGIPDFRSKDGLYNQHDVRFDMYQPEDLLHKRCLYNMPKVFYEFYRQKLDTRNIEPNYAHIFLAELEKEGKLKGIITQNIDGLHQKAGSKKVYEIHGTTARNYCVKCFDEVDKDYIFNSTDLIPRCPKCGQQIRPDVVLYGEMPKVMDEAEDLVREADLLIVAGTSLTVYPARNLINFLEKENNKLVVINRGPVEIEVPIDLEIRGSVGEIFNQLSKIRNK